MDKNEKIVIVGAGLCGTLLAMRMAQRGFKVELYERRSDIRNAKIEGGRSINLALSNRGLKALALVGMDDEVRKECIPMYGRAIHPVSGEGWLSKYSGRQGEWINSVSRGGLNKALLEGADEFDNLTVHFDQKCTGVDIRSGKVTFRHTETGAETSVEDAVVIGTDGAGSAVRRSLMGNSTRLLFNFSQSFLRHGYKELSIPPNPDGTHRIEKNALHIWPRGAYMVIALPNLDGSFTVTMFHPYEGEHGFNELDSADKVQRYFEKEYPDIVPHMPDLVEDYFDNPTGTLGTIKCYPWQANGKVLIMGDAAHAIVPFYGQGMNAAFEDVTVFDQILNEHEGDWQKVFKTFEDERVDDTNAIADLAVDNFHEMKDHVDDVNFKRKRKLEMSLEQNHPEYYSKYSLVTFNENIPYAEAMRKGRLQDKMLLDICEKDENPDAVEVLKMLKEIV